MVDADFENRDERSSNQSRFLKERKSEKGVLGLLVW